MRLCLEGYSQKEWLGYVAQNDAQGFVLFATEFSVALVYFFFDISSISLTPPTVLCYGCWLFSKYSLNLFDTVCEYIFSLTESHFNEASAHLMVERFQQKVYQDERLNYDFNDQGESTSSSIPDDESDNDAFIWNGQEENFLSDIDEPSDRDLSSVCNCDDCLTLQDC